MLNLYKKVKDLIQPAQPVTTDDSYEKYLQAKAKREAHYEQRSLLHEEMSLYFKIMQALVNIDEFNLEERFYVACKGLIYQFKYLLENPTTQTTEELMDMQLMLVEMELLLNNISIRQYISFCDSEGSLEAVMELVQGELGPRALGFHISFDLLRKLLREFVLMAGMPVNNDGGRKAIIDILAFRDDKRVSEYEMCNERYSVLYEKVMALSREYPLES